MLAPQGRLFGTNGVRFIPGVTGDMSFALKLAESIGTYFSEGEILVGRDGRLTGQMMFSSVTAGLMSSGRNIAEADMVPTPALQFSTKALGYRGSVMITASHNPSQYNGVKVMGPDGVEVSRLDEQRIEKIFHDGSANKANWKDVGTARPEPSVIRTYLNGIISKVNAKLIAERRLKVVVDPGNGAQSLAAPYLLEALGCKVITVNSIIDGSFPGRGPEPTPENLRDLVVAVRASNADLGVAYDGDGDRSIFCDEGGNLYWGDQSGSLIADYLLERNPNSTVVTPVSSSQIIEAVAKRRGAKVIWTRVGQRRRVKDDHGEEGVDGLRGERRRLLPFPRPHARRRDDDRDDAGGHGDEGGAALEAHGRRVPEVLPDQDEGPDRPEQGQGDNEDDRAPGRRQGGEGGRPEDMGGREDVGADPPQRHRAHREGLRGVRDEGEGGLDLEEVREGHKGGLAAAS